MTLRPEDVAFVERAIALKRTLRAGWTRVPGVPRVESVADHSWGVALLALLASERDPTLDRGKLLTLALAHDLAEAVVGDLTPADGVGDADKHAREADGLAKLLEMETPEVRRAFTEAWLDYERRGSREARLVADLDKLEMGLQAEDYATHGAKRESLAEFLETARAKIADIALRALLPR